MKEVKLKIKMAYYDQDHCLINSNESSTKGTLHLNGDNYMLTYDLHHDQADLYYVLHLSKKEMSMKIKGHDYQGLLYFIDKEGYLKSNGNHYQYCYDVEVEKYEYSLNKIKMQLHLFNKQIFMQTMLLSIKID
ncbi:MAG: hypothetical protein LBT75_03415 [Bacilli bacterium]|jgi:hypothetical protein|nr:hypothetical protein [Bacilli bacterium]